MRKTSKTEDVTADSTPADVGPDRVLRKAKRKLDLPPAIADLVKDLAQEEARKASESIAFQVAGMKIQLQDAIMLAAERHGYDGKGKDGVVGLLTYLIHNDLRMFVRLLEKLLPFQLTGKNGEPIAVQTFSSVDEVATALRERGLPVPESLSEYKH